jgi:hypothetical protein
MNELAQKEEQLLALVRNGEVVAQFMTAMN